MFVMSVKSGKIKIFLIFVFAAILCFLSIYTVIKGSLSKSDPVLEDGSISLRASTNEERVSFLSQFGWEIDEEPVEVKEIVIPQEFDEQYLKYNEIQKKQNFDLEDYCAVKAKQWTYSVKNYPGYEEQKNCVFANLIVYEGAVIAGDISSSDGKGFIGTFDFPQKEVQTTKAGENIDIKN